MDQSTEAIKKNKLSIGKKMTFPGSGLNAFWKL
jgi:hypothetical protein